MGQKAKVEKEDNQRLISSTTGFLIANEVINLALKFPSLYSKLRTGALLASEELKLQGSADFPCQPKGCCPKFAVGERRTGPNGVTHLSFLSQDWTSPNRLDAMDSFRYSIKLVLAKVHVFQVDIYRRPGVV